MSDYPMLISNKLHSFRNFTIQIYQINNTNSHKSYDFYGYKTTLSPEGT